MQPQFSYVHWLRWFIDIMLLDKKFQCLFLLREAPKSTHVDIKSEAYKYEFGSQAEHPISYIPYYNDMKRNKPLLEEQLQSHHTKVCLGWIQFFWNPCASTGLRAGTLWYRKSIGGATLASIILIKIGLIRPWKKVPFFILFLTLVYRYHKNPVHWVVEAQEITKSLNLPWVCYF